MTGEQLRCEWCTDIFVRPNRRGPAPRYCSRSHRQRAYERRTRASEETVESRPFTDGTRQRANGALGYSSVFANIKLPDYSSVFANIKLPDYSSVFANIKLPDHTNLFANIKFPDYSSLFANLKLTDFSQMFAGIEAAADARMFADLDFSGYLGLLEKLTAEAKEHAPPNGSRAVQDTRSQLLTLAITAAFVIYYQTVLTATGEAWEMALLALEAADSAEDHLPALSGLLFIFSIIGMLETIRRLSLWQRRQQQPEELP